jgi:hypothetical protein
MSTLKELLNWGNKNPRKLFLIDGFGAVVSVFLLGFVLVKLESFFGIPKTTLYLLASLPCLFAVYDFYCFYIVKSELGFSLKVIGISNLLYCVLSLGLAFYHYKELSYFGWTYILMEILIVTTLACFELKTAKILRQKKH